MPALAPIISQTVASTAPCPAGTPVAAINQPAEEVDPGPFTYTVVTGAESFTVDGTTLNAAVELFGANDVGVTATGSDATASAETTATITVAEYVPPEPPNPWDDTEDPYAGNPQVPIPLPPTDAWQMFLRPAVLAIVPRARDGVDFVVARSAKDAPPEILGWDDAVLGEQPTAEIEAEAKRLAAAWPGATPETPVV